MVDHKPFKIAVKKEGWKKTKYMEFREHLYQQLFEFASTGQKRKWEDELGSQRFAPVAHNVETLSPFKKPCVWCSYMKKQAETGSTTRPQGPLAEISQIVRLPLSPGLEEFRLAAAFTECPFAPEAMTVLKNITLYSSIQFQNACKA